MCRSWLLLCLLTIGAVPAQAQTGNAVADGILAAFDGEATSLEGVGPIEEIGDRLTITHFELVYDDDPQAGRTRFDGVDVIAPRLDDGAVLTERLIIEEQRSVIPADDQMPQIELSVADQVYEGSRLTPGAWALEGRWSDVIAAVPNYRSGELIFDVAGVRVAARATEFTAQELADGAGFESQTSISGVTVTGPTAAPLLSVLQQRLGLSDPVLDTEIDIRWTEADGAVDLPMSLSAEGFGRVRLSLQFAGLTPAFVDGFNEDTTDEEFAAMANQLTVTRMTLGLEDNGGLDGAISAMGTQMGLDPEATQEALVQMMIGALTPLAPYIGQDALQNAVRRFVETRGTLTATVDMGEPVPLQAFADGSVGQPGTIDVRLEAN